MAILFSCQREGKCLNLQKLDEEPGLLAADLDRRESLKGDRHSETILFTASSGCKRYDMNNNRLTIHGISSEGLSGIVVARRHVFYESNPE
jgi:hypothetical protein